jgi:vacuolar-type H+-ATPase subunit H
MKELKEKRKKLISEAVMAARDELDEAYQAGVEVGDYWSV